MTLDSTEGKAAERSPGTDDGRTIDLSVVVPVHNESGNVAPLVEEIVAALEERVDFEIVYVDDGSTDGTAAEIAEVAERESRLRVIRHGSCRGQSAAILSGVRAARAAWIATLDGDAQNDPADLPRLLARRDEEEDVQMVSGVRRRRRDGLGKRIASRIANAVRRRLLRDETPDTGCGLKLFRRDAFLALPKFDHMHRFIPALLRARGGRVVFVEVNHRPRRRGRSNYGILDRLWTGIVDLFGVMWLQRRMRIGERDDDG